MIFATFNIEWYFDNVICNVLFGICPIGASRFFCNINCVHTRFGATWCRHKGVRYLGAAHAVGAEHFAWCKWNWLVLGLLKTLVQKFSKFFQLYHFWETKTSCTKLLHQAVAPSCCTKLHQAAPKLHQLAPKSFLHLPQKVSHANRLFPTIPYLS